MKKNILLLITLLLFVLAGFAQTESSKPIVQKAMYFDVSPPLRDMMKAAPEKADNSWKVIKNHFDLNKSSWKSFPEDWTDPRRQRVYNQRATTSDSTIQNFDGNSNTQGYDPPDTYGVVGPNHYFQVVNCHFSIYDKVGTKLIGPVSTSTIWTGMPNNQNGGDAVVMYDKDADRWFIAQLAYPSGYDLVMVAVSQTNDPTGSWYRWEYSFTGLPDYPKWGIWPDGYYMAVNRFNASGSSFLGTGQAVFDRTLMITGDATAQMVLLTLPPSNNAYSMLPSDCSGPFPPAGTPNYFVFFHNNVDYLGVYEFHTDWTNTANCTLGNFIQLNVDAFNPSLSGISQKGTTTKAGTLSDRLMYRLQYRKFNDHWSMVTNHTVNVGGNVSGVRWYELRKTTGDWGIYQQSTYDPGDGNSRWMASCAMDSLGNIGLGFNISSPDMYPAIKYTGRLASDPLNSMTLPEKGIFYGTGSNNVMDGGSTCRWGDYSTLTVDPIDETTFWYSTEYLASMGSGWKTRIGSFTFANILSVMATATPNPVCIGGSTQLNATPTGGSGTYTYSWTSIPAGFTSTISNPIATPAVTTTYIISVNDGTLTVTDSLFVIVNGHPTSNAGPNATYPNTTVSVPLNGTAANYSSLKWLTAGDGSFTSDTAAVTVYTIGSTDRQTGGVLLTLKAYPLMPCADTTSDTVFIRILFPVGVVTNANTAFDVNIMPNPTSGVFKMIVSGSAYKDLQVTISNVEGNTVYTDLTRSVAKDYSRSMDLTTLPKGVYFVKVQTDGHMITKKLVIQ
ncbi:MAG: T9SS type A sorting domain-containing protein [Bacteroidota bacterium]